MNKTATPTITNNPSLLKTALSHFWFKTFSISGFMVVFFAGYLYLLRHPNSNVTTIPATWLDSVISFQPAALPIYLSLWLYVSLPATLMSTRAEVVGYGLRIGMLCSLGLAIFYCWPNAITPANIDWEKYPSVAFLKGIDTAGNAFPSLHVATAVFSALWLYWRIKCLRLGVAIQLVNAIWCVAIAYSTLAIKQHVALDVLAGAMLGVVVACVSGLKTHAGSAKNIVVGTG